jgi:hypothetical protein
MKDNSYVLFATTYPIRSQLFSTHRQILHPDYVQQRLAHSNGCKKHVTHFYPTTAAKPASTSYFRRNWDHVIMSIYVTIMFNSFVRHKKSKMFPVRHKVSWTSYVRGKLYLSSEAGRDATPLQHQCAISKPQYKKPICILQLESPARWEAIDLKSFLDRMTDQCQQRGFKVCFTQVDKHFREPREHFYCLWIKHQFAPRTYI